MTASQTGVYALVGGALVGGGLYAGYVLLGTTPTTPGSVPTTRTRPTPEPRFSVARSTAVPESLPEMSMASTRAEALAGRLAELVRMAPGDGDDEAARIESALLDLGDAGATALLRVLRREHDDTRRAHLLDILRKIPGPAAEAGLIAVALSPDAGISRKGALQALAERRTGPALRALNEVARTDPFMPEESLIVPTLDPRDLATELPDEVVFTPRMSAMAALASTGDARVIPMLAAVLREEPEPALRMEAARDLGQLRQDASTVEALIAAASTDRSPYVRLAALHSLAGVLEPALLDPLTRIAQGDSHAGVRVLAAQILAQLIEALHSAEIGG